ncbi:hypothetical protein L1887_14415 [Cichorium endivia]|nr:hypothetical protein L1887_14415 [Cichorium endivia]
MDATKLIPLIRNVAESKSIKHAKLVHQKVIISGLQKNIAICKNLISLFFSCQLFQSARLVFQSIENPSDITLWNSLISNYTKNYMFNEALQVFEKLMHYTLLKPDSYTYPSVLKACSGLGFANFGRTIHTHLVKNGFVADVVVTSSLLGMYAKCGMFRLAVQVFDEMPERDVACWNTVISCYHHNGQYEKALDLFKKMKNDHGYEPDSVSFTTAISACSKLLNLETGKEIHNEAMRNGFGSDGFVQAALIDMYGKCAEYIFKKMAKTNVVEWNTMISGYVTVGLYLEALNIYKDMNTTQVKPDMITFTSVLAACTQLGALEIGKDIHKSIVLRHFESNEIVMGAVLDMYTKCGELTYGAHGQACESLKLFKEMKELNIKPDRVAFLESQHMSSKLDDITTRLRDLVDQKNGLGLSVNVERSNITERRLEQTSLVDESKIIGREGDKVALLGNEDCDEDVNIVSIVCVSEECDVFNIRKSILEAVGGEDKRFSNLDLLHVALLTCFG